MKARRVGLWATAFSVVFIAAIFGYYSIHNNCCPDDLTEDQLRSVLREAEKGNRAAMMRLFFYYEERENSKAGSFWLQRAANAGAPDAAMFMYSRLFLQDDPAIKKLAMTYLVSAAKHDLPEAQELLGRSYRDGAGVPQNLAYAKHWLRKSALAGDPDGVLELCELALSERDRAQCDECLILINRAMKSMERESYLAKELSHQRERVARELNDSNRSPQ